MSVLENGLIDDHNRLHEALRYCLKYGLTTYRVHGHDVWYAHCVNVGPTKVPPHLAAIFEAARDGLAVDGEVKP